MTPRVWEEIARTMLIASNHRETGVGSSHSGDWAPQLIPSFVQAENAEEVLLRMVIIVDVYSKFYEGHQKTINDASSSVRRLDNPSKEELEGPGSAGSAGSSTSTAAEPQHYGLQSPKEDNGADESKSNR